MSGCVLIEYAQFHDPNYHRYRERHFSKLLTDGQLNCYQQVR